LRGEDKVETAPVTPDTTQTKAVEVVIDTLTNNN